MDRRLSRFIFIVCFPFLLAGCVGERLYVQNTYVTSQQLASSYVNTPDPRKTCPDIGQRVYVHWSLLFDFFNYDEICIVMTVRFGNHEEDIVTIPVKQSVGYYAYSLLNDDYWIKKGILTYKLDLVADGCVIEEWRHQLWTKLITFGKIRNKT